MTQIASELLIERLADWGVDTVFGLPFLKGQPRKAAIATTLFKDKIEQFRR